MADVRTAQRECTGYDRHRLGTPRIASCTPMLAAAYLIAIGLLAHDLLFPLIVAICMGHIGVVGLLSAAELDGPVLRYRRWGKRRQLRLDAVTVVTMARRRRSTMLVLVLRAPGTRPTLVLVSRRSPDLLAVQQPLAGWLHPGAQMSPEAAAVLLHGANVQPTMRSVGQRGLAVAGIMLGSVVLAGIGVSGIDSTSKAFRQAASSASIQSSPTQVARVEAVKVSSSGVVTTRSA